MGIKTRGRMVTKVNILFSNIIDDIAENISEAISDTVKGFNVNDVEYSSDSIEVTGNIYEDAIMDYIPATRWEPSDIDINVLDESEIDKDKIIEAIREKLSKLDISLYSVLQDGEFEALEEPEE